MGLASSSPIDDDGLNGINTDGSSMSGSLSVSAQVGSSIDTAEATVEHSRPNRRSAPGRVFTTALPSGTALIIDPRCLLHVTNMPKFERPARLWG